MDEAQDNDAQDTVLVRHERSVAVITLNRPQVLNAMTLPMARAYARALREADTDPAVRAIVVTGAGRGFCAGADLAILNQGPEAIRTFLPPAEDLPHLALRLRTPVIAAVNGPVAGIGFAYMLGSDVRFAARGVKMSTSFSRLGLVAEYGLSWLLPRLIGTSRAMELLLSGRALGAEEAERIGLVHRVVEPDRLLAEAVDYAADLAVGCSPYSLAAIKAQVYADLERGHDEALAGTLKLMDESFGGPDLAEALAARNAKRPPVFPPLR